MSVNACEIPDQFAADLLAELVSLRLRAPGQDVLLLQLPLAGSVPQFDVQGVPTADLNGQ